MKTILTNARMIEVWDSGGYLEGYYGGNSLAKVTFKWDTGYKDYIFILCNEDEKKKFKELITFTQVYKPKELSNMIVRVLIDGEGDVLLIGDPIEDKFFKLDGKFSVDTLGNILAEK